MKTIIIAKYGPVPSMVEVAVRRELPRTYFVDQSTARWLCGEKFSIPEQVQMSRFHCFHDIASALTYICNCAEEVLLQRQRDFQFARTEYVRLCELTPEYFEEKSNE